MIERIKKLEVECEDANETQKIMSCDIISLKNKINVLVDEINDLKVGQK
jgi:hypothetical protein